MYGRGAGDMKSGLAAMVGAVRGLQRLGLAPRAQVQLQSVVEEECTGNGALACVLAGHTADAAILTEPTRGAIWNAQVGVLWFQVRVLGAPAHAGDARRGRQRDRGVVRRDRARCASSRPSSTSSPPPLYAAYPHPINLNVGMIRGGDWPSTVAGECVTALPARALSRRARRRRSSSASSRPSRRSPRAAPSSRATGIEVLYDGFQCEGYELAPDAPLVTGLPDARRARDRRTRRRCSPRPRRPTRARSSSTATRPRSASARVAENEHGVDERVHLPSVTSTAQAIALFIADWCGAASRPPDELARADSPPDSCPPAPAAPALRA